jgi:cytochrome c peroxidase
MLNCTKAAEKSFNVQWQSGVHLSFGFWGTMVPRNHPANVDSARQKRQLRATGASLLLDKALEYFWEGRRGDLQKQA